MMLEAHAVDLYLRFADRHFDQKVKKILCHLADEEKAHLHSLGGMLEQKM
jgi:rubrerythrin